MTMTGNSDALDILKNIKPLKSIKLICEKCNAEYGMLEDHDGKRFIDHANKCMCERITINTFKSRIDKFFMDNDFKVHDEELKIYYEKLGWITKGVHILLFGNPGSHKTGQVTAIAKKALKMGYSVIYIRATEIVYQKSEIVNRMLNCDLLIIDNVGFDAEFENKRGAAFDIVDKRVHNYKSTIMITNENPSYDEAYNDRMSLFQKIRISRKSDRSALIGKDKREVAQNS